MALPENLSVEFMGDGLTPQAKGEPSIDELLEASVKAVKDAPSRSVKRRLRQRLHKKLGSLLGQDEYEAALSRLKSMEEAAGGSASDSGEPAEQRRSSSDPRSNQMQLHSHGSQPGWQPVPTVGPRQHARQIMRAMGHNVSEAIEELEDAAVDAWQEGCIPVARTFVHFELGRKVARERSMSL
mmetsp:Transcript_148/g.351  ORF Transcript_148/g.351 Transcript_148/m.351 type:complete len:183 (-) Transcript_148:302-850(-)